MLLEGPTTYADEDEEEDEEEEEEEDGVSLLTPSTSSTRLPSIIPPVNCDGGTSSSVRRGVLLARMVKEDSPCPCASPSPCPCAIPYPLVSSCSLRSFDGLFNGLGASASAAVCCCCNE